MQAIEGYIHRTTDYASNLPSLFADRTEPVIVTQYYLQETLVMK